MVCCSAAEAVVMGLFSDHRGGCGDTSCCSAAEAVVASLLFCCLGSVMVV